MTQPDSSKIRRSITRFRRLALCSAALIMMINLLMVYRITSVLNHGSSSKINISGRQRLLSQMIRSDAYEIETAVRSGQWDKLPPLLDELATSTSLFSTVHGQLFAERTPDELFRHASTAQRDLIASIQIPFRQLTAASGELEKLTINTIRRSPYIDEQTHTRILACQQEIARAQSLFLPKMQTIVDLFEQASRDEINASIRHARIGMMILLGVLGATVIFILEPTILIIRRQLRDLDQATRVAKRADAVRWRLLTNMGHEFRTPMNAIMGFAELLREDTLSEGERSRLGHSIFHASTQLTHLIETMLDMSAIESGQLRIVLTRCDLHQMLTRISVDARARAAAKGLGLSLVIAPDCPRHISTDCKRLEQILHKLIDNAIKFTHEGGVEITASLDARGIEVVVADTGIGISPESLGAVFDPFMQGEDNLTRSFGGAGLGLTIARDLARSLGGDITVASTPDRGSVFTLTTAAGDIEQEEPQAALGDASPAQDHSPAHDRAFTGLKILIVDDAKDNRVLLQHIFRNSGAHIEFAHDGEQAIHAVHTAADAGESFSLILMDMQMPVLDGYAASSRLREQGVSTPIIALTAHALDGDRERCIQAGCDDYMSKPVNRAQLLDACTRLIIFEDTPRAAA